MLFRSELAEMESGPAHMRAPAQVSQLTKHWDAARKEFEATGNKFVIEDLLALGAIRAVYWLAVSTGELTLAKDIAEWWEDCAPVHGLGGVIR